MAVAATGRLVVKQFTRGHDGIFGQVRPGDSTVGSPAEAGVSADSSSSVRQAGEESAMWCRSLIYFGVVGGFPA